MKKPVDNTHNNRLRNMEEKIEQLRFSRRVLMNLVERLEKEKAEAVENLERMNKRLQLQNTKYARVLWHKNRQIIELEAKLFKKDMNSAL